MKSYFFLFLLVLVINSCEKNKSEIIVDTPKGWKRIDTVYAGQKKIKFFQILNDSMPFLGAMVITRDKAPGNLDECYRKAITELQKKFKEFHEYDQGYTEIAGYKAKWTQYRCMLFDDTESIDQKLYLVKVGDYVYGINGGTDINNLNKLQKTLDEVLSSIRFK